MVHALAPEAEAHKASLDYIVKVWKKKKKLKLKKFKILKNLIKIKNLCTSKVILKASLKHLLSFMIRVFTVTAI